MTTERDSARSPRAWVLVDYSNCTSSLERSWRDRRTSEWRIDWRRFPEWLVQEAGRLLGMDSLLLTGKSVFSSFTPDSEPSERHREFCYGTLRAKLGYEVTVLPRRPRHPSECSNCGGSIASCPYCGKDLSGWQEKGVDTALSFRMALVVTRDEADVIILVSNDRDFEPNIKAIQQSGVAVVHAAFAPQGGYLSDRCDAAIDINRGRNSIEFRRPRRRS